MEYAIERVFDGEVYPPRGVEDGLHFIITPYREIETPYGGGYNIDDGGDVWLMDGPSVVASREIICKRGLLEDRQEAAARRFAPWAASVAHLARAERRARQMWPVMSIMEQAGYTNADGEFVPQAEFFVAEEEAWLAKAQKFAAPADLIPPADWPEWKKQGGMTTGELGLRIIARLGREERGARLAAGAALPAAPLPRLSRDWAPWWPKGDSWADSLATLIFERWKMQGEPAPTRDDVVRWALDLEISKSAVHRGTGIARSTIDRILED